MEQGSKEWLTFRRDKIGASDAAVIMGLTPPHWKMTPYKLWKQKIEGTETVANFAMQRGTALEPIARAKFIEQTGHIVEPKVSVSHVRPWQMASLDGVTKDGKIATEIKCGGKELYEQALQNIIPPYYICQMQHQYAVEPAEDIFYCCFYEGNIKVLGVGKDEAFIEDMNKKEFEFYQCLVNKEPPALTDQDYEVFENDKASEFLKEYLESCQMEKTIKAKKDLAKENLIAVSPERNYILDGVKVYQTQNSSYDTKKMMADGINIDAYKKLSKPYWMVASPRGKQNL